MGVDRLACSRHLAVVDELCDRICEVVVACVSRMRILFFEGERSQICILVVDVAAETS